ncbi:MAG: Dihydroorotase [uncultured Chloroflexi bacterium]|uniref:Dihydroorotase n=1 Tax=uncultured Chloroflexota bacterium TaxID=166587 RepID=A0A6J4K6E6_9CHLR|nr:MAG: Dihydroorotase [uncultured Chloroflexota bacterium]
MTPEDRALVSEAKHGATYDVLLRGGEVLDPSAGLRAPRDVAFAWGRVAAVAEQGQIGADQARVVINASGKLVTPGLIDLHTHVYVGGSELVVPADEIGPPSGVTTVVDAGTGGGNTILGLRLLSRQTRTRMFAFVHISSIGLAGHPHGESRDLVYLDPELAARAVLSHQGFVLGVKVRQTQRIVGESGLEPLRRAVQAAEIAQELVREQERRLGMSPEHARRVPVMVHVGSAPATLDELLGLLRPGDVVTHCFNAGSNDLLRADGSFEPAAQAARQRGIQFDVGHGNGSFSYKVAKGAADAGFWPDTISTDLHSASVQYRAVDMPTTMSKFLGLGMSLEEVIARSTVAPARYINGALPHREREPLLGTLQVGAPGDAAVFQLEEGEIEFHDATGYRWTGSQSMRAVHTVLHGRVWGRPYAHPYLMP